MDILVVAALVPAIIVMWYIWKMDKVEKEPTNMIMKVAIAGAISTVSAIILELVGESVLKNVIGMDETSIAYGAADFFLVVAGAEELGKLVALRLRTWRSKEFNYTYDAVVYAVASSLGFAALENVMYVAMFGLGTAFVRAFTAVPGHAMFGVFMGYYYGMARQAWGRGKKGAEIRNMILAFVVPVILHGIYDFLLFEYLPDGAMFVWLIFLVLIFIMAMFRIHKLAAMDTPILGTGLDFPEEKKPASGTAPVDIYGQPYPSPMRSEQPVQAPVSRQPYAQPQPPQRVQAPSYGQPQPPQYGQPSYGQPSYSQPQAPQRVQAPSYGQPQPPRYGQPSYSQPSYAQPQAPQYRQPQSYGQPQPPQYGQASYSQPSYDQPQAPQYGQAQSYGQPAYEPEPAPAPEPPPRPRKIYHPEGMAIPDGMQGLLSEIDEEPSIRYDPFGIAPAQIIRPSESGAQPAPPERAAVRDLGGRPDPAMDEQNIFGSLADNAPARHMPEPMPERRLPPLDPL